MPRKAIVTAGMLFVLLISAASASGASISLENHPRHWYSRWVFSRAGCGPCEHWRLHDHNNGAKVFQDSDFFYGSTGYTAIYRWSCVHTGTHHWTGTIWNKDGTVAIQRSHAFSVPPCGKRKPRLVGRGKAAQIAHQGWGYEFVSSDRCQATSPVHNGAAAHWTCLVTHNNAYRECTDRVVLRFWKRSVFGNTGTVRSYFETIRRVGPCTYF